MKEQIPITSWDETYDLNNSKVGDWEDKIWGAVAKDCNHRSYMDTIRAINDLANTYNIATDLEGCAITPLHFIFAKYIGQDAMIPILLEKMLNID